MDYLVLKKTANGEFAEDWTPVTIARAVEGEGAEALEAACQQGYTGDGRYKAIPWPTSTGSEFDLGPVGPPPATPVIDEPAEE